MNSAKRMLASVSIAAAALLALSACDPPMPPEVQARLAEQSYTCEPGTATVAFTTNMTPDLTQGWSDNLTYTDCAGSMMLTPSYAYKGAGLIAADYAPAATDCTIAAQVPFAIEAGVLLYQLSDASSLYLSKDTTRKILSRQITNWNDPAIAHDNPTSQFSDLPITIRKTADANAFGAFANWIFGSTSTPATAIKTDIETDFTKFKPLAEGEIAIAPNSFAVGLGLYPASILVGSDPNKSEDVANPDPAGILSAGTQLKPSTQGSNVSIQLDNSISPTPPDGVDIVAAPYQAIYAVNLYLCQDNLLNRAIARYLLRQDSQGALGASNYTQLSEPVRDAALIAISQGLPSPSSAPTN